MARCPSCHKSFRVMEDEENMHDCPRCGYGPGSAVRCMWCDGEQTYEQSEEFGEYCSELCAARAEADSVEDSQ